MGLNCEDADKTQKLQTEGEARGRSGFVRSSWRSEDELIAAQHCAP